MNVINTPVRPARGGPRAARPAPTGIAALNAAIWSICDVLRRSKCAGAMQYVPELTWILFLRVLDDKEEADQGEAEAVGASFTPALSTPYRWRDWAAPGGAKRKELEDGKLGEFFGFVNGDLIPHLKGLAQNPNATPGRRSSAKLCRASRKRASIPKRTSSTCSTGSMH